MLPGCNAKFMRALAEPEKGAKNCDADQQLGAVYCSALLQRATGVRLPLKSVRLSEDTTYSERGATNEEKDITCPSTQTYQINNHFRRTLREDCVEESR